MPVLKQICLIALMIVFLIKYCNSKNRIGTLHYIPMNSTWVSYGEIMCKSGEMIDLMSYKFDNNRTTEEEFSDTEELELYQKCSMQERCTNLRFPTRSGRQRNNTYDAVIKFQCIDPMTSNIMDMCYDGNRSFNYTLNLMYNGSSTISTRCECYIDGKFSVTINDVRLGVKQLNACSSANLKINRYMLNCMENITNFGYIFQRKILFNIHLVYIALTLNSTSSPTMVWLKIEPTDVSYIICTTMIALTTSNLPSTFTDYVPIYDNVTGNITTVKSGSSVEETDSKVTGSQDITHTVVIIICVCSTCVLWVIIIVVVTSCKRRKKKKSLRNKECVRQTGSTEQVQAINPASEEERSPFHVTYIECEHHKTGACECYADGAAASRTRFAVSKAVVGNTETPDDGSYYNVRIKLASANETTHQAYFESQFHKQGACGYDTEAGDSKRNIPTELMMGSDTLQDEANYYNVPVKLSTSRAVYEKIQPELKCNDGEYAHLDQKRV